MKPASEPGVRSLVAEEGVGALLDDLAGSPRGEVLSLRVDDSQLVPGGDRCPLRVQRHRQGVIERREGRDPLAQPVPLLDRHPGLGDDLPPQRLIEPGRTHKDLSQRGGVGRVPVPRLVPHLGDRRDDGRHGHCVGLDRGEGLVEGRGVAHDDCSTVEKGSQDAGVGQRKVV